MADWELRSASIVELSENPFALCDNNPRQHFQLHVNILRLCL